MFRIGDFSKLTQVSIRMLPYYDETGLLKPAQIDKFTSYRLYSANQILTGTYQFLCNWIEQNNYEIIGINRQVCIKGHWNETNPQNYLNEIQMPVKKINR